MRLGARDAGFAVWPLVTRLFAINNRWRDATTASVPVFFAKF